MKKSSNKTVEFKTSYKVFECTMCGECCKGYGGTYIDKDHIKKIAKFMNISRKNFVSKYTELSGNKTILIQKKDGFCIFWEEEKACLIHPVKPKMCEKWPFILPVLVDFNNWKTMGNSCPGIKKDASDIDVISHFTKKEDISQTEGRYLLKQSR